MSFVQIAGKLKQLLGTIPEIKDVIDYPEDVFKVASKDYPIALIVESGNEADYLTNKEGLRIYAYEIWIVHKAKNKPLKTVWQELRTAVDKVLEALKAEETSGNPLGGVVDYVTPNVARFETTHGTTNELYSYAIVVVRAAKVYS